MHINQIFFKPVQDEITKSFDKMNVSMFGDSSMSSMANESGSEASENESSSFNDIKAYNTDSSSLDNSSVSNDDSNNYDNSSFVDLIEESDRESFDFDVKRSRNFKSINTSKVYNLNRQPYRSETFKKWRSSGKIVQSTPVKSSQQSFQLNKQTFKARIDQRQVFSGRDYFSAQNVEALIVNSWVRGSEEPDQPYTFSDSKGGIRLKLNNQIFINSMQRMKMDGTRYLYWNCLMKYSGECASRVISIKRDNKHIINEMPSEHEHEVKMDHLRPSRDLTEAEIITNGYQACYKGYTYNRNDNGGESERSTWVCKVRACFGMISTIGSKIIHSVDCAHNHSSASK